MTKKELNREAIRAIHNLTTFENEQAFERMYDETSEWMFHNQDSLDAYCELRELMSTIRQMKISK